MEEESSIIHLKVSTGHSTYTGLQGLWTSVVFHVVSMYFYSSNPCVIIPRHREETWLNYS